MKFSNKTNQILYYSVDNNDFVNENEAIQISRIYNIDSYYNFLHNGLNTLRRPGVYKYFSGLASIPPGSVMVANKNHYEIISSINRFEIDYSRSSKDLMNEIKNKLNDFGSKKIGVELSGGLDSSLIIEALLNIGIDPVLIGFSSDKFEFRTEKEIQKIYLERVSQSVLLRYEDCLAFDNLKETPLHPIPVSESHFFNRHLTVANVAKKYNVDILFSGEAGDQILSFPINIKDKSYLPTEFSYWCLAEHWSNQYVYNKIGLNYLSGMALGSIPSLLISLRGIQPWDPMKLWARKQFKSCLPKELSDFAYTAFHNGWVSDGLKNASDTIEEISDFAFKEFKICELKPQYMRNQSIIYSTLDEEKRKIFLLNLAFITWFYSISK